MSNYGERDSPKGVFSPQVRAGKVASTCREGCKSVQGRLQVRASEMGKTGTNIACPVLDKRKGRRDTPHTSHCSLREISSEPVKGEIPTAL